VRNGRVNLALTHQINPRTFVTAGVTADTMTGDAEDSPLVHRKTSVISLLAAAYAF
jgi:outer membrane scaffolding protein for murein synthesis (MipA/OmpV family)